jgi:hypothetical protein
MSFLYPNTITVKRLSAPSGKGLVSYPDPQSLTDVGTFDALIDFKKDSGHVPVNLPGDASKRTYWTIGVRAPKGTFLEWDLATDENGARYQIVAPYWTPLGYAMLAERLDS